MDYQGRRLLAQCLLPVGADTIVQGTADAGRTFHCSNMEAQNACRALGSFLGLAEHKVMGGGSSVLAADIECHRGRNGKLYLLDVRRCLLFIWFGPSEQPLTLFFPFQFSS